MVEKPWKTGDISDFALNGIENLSEGRLRIGSAMQTHLIRELKNSSGQEAEVIVYDSPPGTSCPVVASISDADFVILVTEPTPFGLHDLKLSIEVVRELKKDFGVLINKDGIGDNNLDNYLIKEGIEILGRIAFNKHYASDYARGFLMGNVPKEIMDTYKNLVSTLKGKHN
jgi:MinD superfamily P-loop ATPase